MSSVPARKRSSDVLFTEVITLNTRKEAEEHFSRLKERLQEKLKHQQCPPEKGVVMVYSQGSCLSMLYPYPIFGKYTKTDSHPVFVAVYGNEPDPDSTWEMN